MSSNKPSTSSPSRKSVGGVSQAQSKSKVKASPSKVGKHKDSKPKSILKSNRNSKKSSTRVSVSSSKSKQNLQPKKSAKFDEINIIETHHPPGKDYGHMKIEEPNTPYNYANEEDSKAAALDAEELVKRLLEKKESNRSKRDLDNQSEAEDPGEIEKKADFDSKRKAHYNNEVHTVKLAKKLLDEDSVKNDKHHGHGQPNPATKSPK